MEKNKALGRGLSQMGKTLGKWDDMAEEGSSRSKQLIMARTSTNNKRLALSPKTSSSSTALDRRGRRTQEEDSLVNNVKAFVGKTTDTVDQYEEARKKSKINRFFKGVRNIFPKRKKKSKDSKDHDERSPRGRKDRRAAASDSDSDEEEAKQKSKLQKKEKDEEEKEREIGGGKFQEKERRRREEIERQRQSELDAARRQRRKLGVDDEDEDDAKDKDEKNSASEDEIEEERLEDKRQRKKQEQLLLKRSQSTPGDKMEKAEVTVRSGLGIREKYRAKLEAKKASMVAELQKEETEKEKQRQIQAAKAENAAIDSFLERAAQRRRGTEERVGFRSKRTSGNQKGDDDEEVLDEDDDAEEQELRRRLLGEGASRNAATRAKAKPKAQNSVRSAAKEDHDKERAEPAPRGKKTAVVKGQAEAELLTKRAKVRPEKAQSAVTPRGGTKKTLAEEGEMSASMDSIGISAAKGGAKLVGRFVQQLVDSDEEGFSDEGREKEEEDEAPRVRRWQDRERHRKVQERIEETRRQRQAQAQGRRPSLGKSYSWASTRSGDIPVPLTSNDRMLAAIEGAAARNSPRQAASPRPGQASPGGADRTLWHRKARALRERSQRSLVPAGGGSSRSTSSRKLPARGDDDSADDNLL